MRNNIQIVVIIIIVTFFFGYLIIHEKTHHIIPLVENIEDVESEIYKNDSIFEMVDRKWNEQKIHKQRAENEMDSLMVTLDGKKLTIELMEGIKEKFIKAKKECDKKSVTIDSLNNRYNKDIKVLQSKFDNTKSELSDTKKHIEELSIREIKLINIYNHEVDSLKGIIITLKNTPIIDTVFVNKRNYRKQNQNNQ